MVAETNTTQCCYRCLARTIAVWKKGRWPGGSATGKKEGKATHPDQGGLKFCDSERRYPGRCVKITMNIGVRRGPSGGHATIRLTHQSPAIKRTRKFFPQQPGHNVCLGEPAPYSPRMRAGRLSVLERKAIRCDILGPGRRFMIGDTLNKVVRQNPGRVRRAGEPKQWSSQGPSA
jgi:hypothetical protein